MKLFGVKMPMRKSVILCLMIVSTIAFASSSKVPDVLYQGSQAIKRAVVPKMDATDTPDAHSISVTGTITARDGGIAENLTVKVFAGKMSGSPLMGSELTDGGGAYTIAFASNSEITVIVKVYCKTKLLATSAPAYNVTEGVSIDLTVPSSKCEPGPSLKQIPGWPLLKKGGQ